MGGKRERKRQTDKGRDVHEMKVKETNKMNVAVEVRVWAEDKGRQPEA